MRPLTDSTPKCLLPIQGVPLLEKWLRLLSVAGVESVLINTHHLHEQVQAFVAERRGQMPRITLAYEPSLLGSAGTLRKNRSFVDGDSCFFILYADNLTNIDLKRLLAQHKTHSAKLTIAAYRTNSPMQKGIFEVDDCGRAISFEEKPLRPKSNLANSGLAVADREILEIIEDRIPLDFARDVMPHLLRSTIVVETDAYIRDIGTAKDYTEANREWAAIGQNL